MPSCQIFGVNNTGNFGQDRERIRIPFEQIHDSASPGCAIGDSNARAVVDRIAFFFRGTLSSTIAIKPLRFIEMISPFSLCTNWTLMYFAKAVGLRILLRLFRKFATPYHRCGTYAW